MAKGSPWLLLCKNGFVLSISSSLVCLPILRMWCHNPKCGIVVNLDLLRLNKLLLSYFLSEPENWFLGAVPGKVPQLVSTTNIKLLGYARMCTRSTALMRYCTSCAYVDGVWPLVECDFWQKMWPILEVPFRTSAEGSLHADINGANPSFTSHSNAWIRLSSDSGYTE